MEFNILKKEKEAYCDRIDERIHFLNSTLSQELKKYGKTKDLNSNPELLANYGLFKETISNISAYISDPLEMDVEVVEKAMQNAEKCAQLVLNELARTDAKKID